MNLQGNPQRVAVHGLFQLLTDTNFEIILHFSREQLYNYIARQAMAFTRNGKTFLTDLCQ